MERTPARTFEDLIVWQKSHALVLAVYQASSGFPACETYGLRSQLRRAIVSVPANIVEGFRKRGRADKARFLNIAQASLEEARYYLILAQDLKYIGTQGLKEQMAEVGRLLQSYTRNVLESDS